MQLEHDTPLSLHCVSNIILRKFVSERVAQERSMTGSTMVAREANMMLGGNTLARGARRRKRERLRDWRAGDT